MAMPWRPIAARPLSASRGNSLSRSQRAACGASCSVAKRRTASRISLWADIGERVVRKEPALLAVTLGDAVDAPAAELEDARGAVDMLALGGREERGVELGGERVAFDAEPRLDREPHRAVGRRHQRRAVDDAAGTLERGLVRQFERALPVAYRNDPEAIRPQEA